MGVCDESILIKKNYFSTLTRRERRAIRRDFRRAVAEVTEATTARVLHAMLKCVDGRNQLVRGVVAAVFATHQCSLDVNYPETIYHSG
jgi:hypothetical protein